eukprot:COSAG01_NODE_264_length_19971_cov_62.193923_3_plen_65_part_00
MHAPCLLAADSVGESLWAAASSQTACCVPVQAVWGACRGACQVHAVLDGGLRLFIKFIWIELFS